MPHEPEQSARVHARLKLEQSAMTATAASIADLQQPSGMILWFPEGHSDPWNHTECAMALSVAGLTSEADLAYQWLADAQHAEGWWHHYYLTDRIEDAKIDTNVCAYVAAGVWHQWLITNDRGFLETMWPVVERAIDFVLTMQKRTGEVIWARHTDGTPWSYALLTGSSSIYHSLRCALEMARELGLERPLWELGAVRLGDRIARDPGAFEPKDRWAMDWYYPVLAGAVTGEAATERMASGRSKFIMEGKGVRCVSDNPWITAAETCECAMAYLNVGDGAAAAELFDWVQNLRDEHGAYFTGMVYPDEIRFPDEEQSTYSSAAVILAADAINQISPASGLFRGNSLPRLSAS